jgi:hypothetical protein
VVVMAMWLWGWVRADIGLEKMLSSMSAPTALSDSLMD